MTTLNFALQTPGERPSIRKDLNRYEFHPDAPWIDLTVQEAAVSAVLESILKAANQTREPGQETLLIDENIRLQGTDPQGNIHALTYRLVRNMPEENQNTWTVDVLGKDPARRLVLGTLPDVAEALQLVPALLSQKLHPAPEVDALKADFEEVCQVLDGLHRFPLQLAIVVFHDATSGERGKFVPARHSPLVNGPRFGRLFFGYAGGKLVTERPQATFLHELGHALDSELARAAGLEQEYFSETISADIKRVFDGSSLRATYDAERKKFPLGTPKGKMLHARLKEHTDPKELFAQFYMQYVYARTREVRRVEQWVHYFEADRKKKGYDQRTFTEQDEKRIVPFMQNLLEEHGLAVNAPG